MKSHMSISVGVSCLGPESLWFCVDDAKVESTHGGRMPLFKLTAALQRAHDIAVLCQHLVYAPMMHDWLIPDPSSPVDEVIITVTHMVVEDDTPHAREIARTLISREVLKGHTHTEPSRAYARIAMIRSLKASCLTMRSYDGEPNPTAELVVDHLGRHAVVDPGITTAGHLIALTHLADVIRYEVISLVTGEPWMRPRGLQQFRIMAARCGLGLKTINCVCQSIANFNTVASKEWS